MKHASSRNDTHTTLEQQEQNIARFFHILSAGIVFVVAFLLMSYIQFNPDNPYISEFDSYYHVKMAQLILERGLDFSSGIFAGIANAGGVGGFLQVLSLFGLFGLSYWFSHKNKVRNGLIVAGIGAVILILNSIFIQHFPWLYFTTLNEKYVNHHLLFHIMMIPFLQIFGTFTGAKLTMILSTAACFLFFYLILKHLKVPLPLLWSLIAIFTMSSDFYYRLSFIKAIPLSLAYLMAIMYFAFKNKAGIIAVLSFLYVWSYGGFTFLPIFAVVYLVAQIVCKEKVDWKLPVAMIGGTMLGLIMNPYFPKNFEFLFLQIFQTGLGAKSYVGGEWANYESFFWLTINWIPVFIFMAGIALGFISSKTRPGAKVVSMLMMSFLFLILVWKSKRFVEYSPFFLTLSGLALMQGFMSEKAEELKQNMVKPTLENGFYALVILTLLIPIPLAHIGGEKDPIVQANGSVKEVHRDCTGLAIPPSLINFALCEIKRARGDTQTLFSMSALLQVHQYLLENAQEGDIVFTDDWDVFPRYFFANSKTYYLVGLDPEFMNQYEGAPYPGEPGKLYQEFAAISSGGDANNLERIKEHFKAKWVIVNVDHGQFYQNLKNRPDLFTEVLFSRNDPQVDKYPAAVGDGYYLFKVL